MNESAIAALLVWTGLHVILMLALALNVSRHRFQSDSDEGYDERRLVKAIRAHGNNIEYVPIILFCIALLVVVGATAAWVHALCATLFVARLLHAHGIQQFTHLPKSRIIGNFATWGVMLGTAIALVYQGLGG